MTARSGSPARTASIERRRVGRPADDLVPGVLEEPGQTFAEERRVLTDHDAHGSAASTTVPRPTRLATVSDPPRAATRSASPDSPEPARRHAADAVVADPHQTTCPSTGATCSSIGLASACLTALVTASLAT